MADQARPTTLRERTRRAVRAELLDTGQRLFVTQGYEATTVDQIAEAAGMSKRSFFRYFSSKEDLVIEKYDGLVEQFADALAARPAAETLWESLRRVFDYVVDYAADAELAARMAVLDQVVQDSDALRAAYLERLDRARERMAMVAAERATAVGATYSADDPTLRAVVGAAFACLDAARQTASADTDLGAALDRAMAALVPTIVPSQGVA